MPDPGRRSGRQRGHRPWKSAARDARRGDRRSEKGRPLSLCMSSAQRHQGARPPAPRFGPETSTDSRGATALRLPIQHRSVMRADYRLPLHSRDTSPLARTPGSPRPLRVWRLFLERKNAHPNTTWELASYGAECGRNGGIIVGTDMGALSCTGAVKGHIACRLCLRGHAFRPWRRGTERPCTAAATIAIEIGPVSPGQGGEGTRGAQG